MSLNEKVARQFAPADVHAALKRAFAGPQGNLLAAWLMHEGNVFASLYEAGDARDVVLVREGARMLALRMLNEAGLTQQDIREIYLSVGERGDR